MQDSSFRASRIRRPLAKFALFGATCLLSALGAGLNAPSEHAVARVLVGIPKVMPFEPRSIDALFARTRR